MDIRVVVLFLFTLVACTKPTPPAPPPRPIEFREAPSELRQGAEVTINVTAGGGALTAAEKQQLRWTSSATSIASVIGGRVKGLAPGLAKITATLGSERTELTLRILHPLAGTWISEAGTRFLFQPAADGTLEAIRIARNEETATSIGSTDPRAVRFWAEPNARECLKTRYPLNVVAYKGVHPTGEARWQGDYEARQVQYSRMMGCTLQSTWVRQEFVLTSENLITVSDIGGASPSTMTRVTQ